MFTAIISTVFSLFKSIAGRNWLYIIIILALLSFCFLKQCQFEKASKDSKDYKALYKSAHNRVVQFRKEGRNHTQVAATVISTSNINNIEDKRIQDLKGTVGNLRKNLIGYSRVAPLSQGSFSAKVRDTLLRTAKSYLSIPVLPTSKNDYLPEMESMPGKTFSFKDEFLIVMAVIAEDSVSVRYKISNPFEIYYYYKRPGKGLFKIFRKKEAVAEIKFLNPNTSSDSLYSVILDRSNSFLKLGK